MKPIYEPRGRAKEYADLALNIYTGCPHGCYYCFAPNVLRKDIERFHSDVRPRIGIVEETVKQLEREGITGKLIQLCFACDPYPTGYDTMPTRKIIEALKAHGNHVQILTKGDGTRDFDLLDGNDWYGITVSGGAYNLEPGAISETRRLVALHKAYSAGIKTWVSYEPVLDAGAVLASIETWYWMFDRIKVGKLNYHPSNIDWPKFGRDVEALCKRLGVDCYIKESLRAEMEK